MKAIVPPETPGTTSAIPMAHPLSASTMYREKFMVCLRILVLNAKIRISRIQKQTCLRFCSGGVSSAQPKIGDKRRTPAFRKLSFHQFFGSLPFFAPACVRRCRTFSRSPAGSGDIACGKASAASRELSPGFGASYGETGPAADSRALRNGSERAIPPARGTPCCGG